MTADYDIEFITDLVERGFDYDSNSDSYIRKWVTEYGHESILEIYKKMWDTNQWKQSMVGYGNVVFYEEIVE